MRDYHPRIDWAIGIVAGLVLGVAIVAAFLFLGSEQTIDGASIHGVDTGKPGIEAQPSGPEGFEEP